MFVHDAVLDSLTCGNTQIPASSMKKAIARLARSDPVMAQSGYTTQFQVRSTFIRVGGGNSASLKWTEAI